MGHDGSEKLVNACGLVATCCYGSMDAGHSNDDPLGCGFGKETLPTCSCGGLRQGMQPGEVFINHGRTDGGCPGPWAAIEMDNSGRIVSIDLSGEVRATAAQGSYTGLDPAMLDKFTCPGHS